MFRFFNLWDRFVLATRNLWRFVISVIKNKRVWSGMRVFNLIATVLLSVWIIWGPQITTYYDDAQLSRLAETDTRYIMANAIEESFPQLMVLDVIVNDEVSVEVYVVLDDAWRRDAEKEEIDKHIIDVLSSVVTMLDARGIAYFSLTWCEIVNLESFEGEVHVGRVNVSLYGSVVQFADWVQQDGTMDGLAERLGEDEEMDFYVYLHGFSYPMYVYTMLPQTSKTPKPWD